MSVRLRRKERIRKGEGKAYKGKKGIKWDGG